MLSLTPATAGVCFCTADDMAATLPEEIPLRRSRYLIASFTLIGVGALKLVCLYLPSIAAGIAVCLLIWATCHALALHALRIRSGSITALRWIDTKLMVRTRSEDWMSAQVLPGALVTPWLTVVRLRTQADAKSTFVLVLVPDALHPDAFRRLRMRLHWLPPDESDTLGR